MARWSKNGRYVLTLGADTTPTPSLSLIDMKANTIIPLRINTLPSKCHITDSGPVMYCGVPKAWTTPDSYLKGKIGTDDRIMKVDFRIPKVTELWSGGTETTDIENPMPIGTELFFTNRADGSVLKLAL
jgi:hypothetical protein